MRPPFSSQDSSDSALENKISFDNLIKISPSLLNPHRNSKPMADINHFVECVGGGLTSYCFRNPVSTVDCIGIAPKSTRLMLELIFLGDCNIFLPVNKSLSWHCISANIALVILKCMDFRKKKFPLVQILGLNTILKLFGQRASLRTLLTRFQVRNQG